MDLIGILSLAGNEIISPMTVGYILCGIGLAVHFGFTGLLNFGQAAFAALGGYGFAIATLDFHWNIWGSILFGLVCSMAFAALLGIPTLRLRADYLAIVTIAAAQALRFYVGSSTAEGVTGGSAGISQFGTEFYGLNPIPKDTVWNLGTVALTADQIWMRIVAWLVVALIVVLLFALTRSPWGRVLKGIREDEDAVRALGKNVFSYKLQALVIGGSVASIGGMVFVMSSQTNQPSNWGTNFTFLTWTILLLGGAATLLGPIVGGMVFFGLMTLIESILGVMVDAGLLPFLQIEQVAQIRFLLVGLILMLLVIFRPQGFFGNKKEVQFNG
jgi:branched-chain amino acid transport system permease protein